MVLRRLAYGFSSVALSVSSLFVLASPVAHAATVAWDGEGADNNFSTAANWVGDVVPVNGDAITFDLATGISDGDVINNDLTGLQLSGITVTGDGGGIQGPTLGGNNIDLQGTFSVSYGGAYFNVSADITLTGDLTVSGSGGLFFLADSAINVAGHALNFTNYYVTIDGTIAGSGAISFSVGADATLNGSNTTSAAINVNGPISVWKSDSLGSGTVTIGEQATVKFCGLNGATVSSNFVLNNANISVPSFATNGMCGKGGGASAFDPMANVVLAGDITLQQDTKVAPYGELKITGVLSGAHTISIADGVTGTLVVASSNNTSNTPNGSAQSGLKTTEITDKYPAVTVDAQTNEVIVIKDGGERGAVSVIGGTLKGTGTVGAVTMSSGKVAPGLSPGILNTGNLSFSGGTLEIEIGGATAGNGDGFHDQTNVTGTVDLGSNATTLTTTLWNSFAPTVGQSYTIINNDSNDAVTGTFVGMADDSSFTQNGVTYTINYNGGDGNDVVLTVTAVPATATAPNTGFEHLSNNPLLTLISTLGIVAALGVIARKQLKGSK